MLEEFAYLGEETAYEVVVKNTRAIADLIEKVRPLPPAKTLYAPKIDNSAEDLKKAGDRQTPGAVRREPRPEIVTKRAENRAERYPGPRLRRYIHERPEACGRLAGPRLSGRLQGQRRFFPGGLSLRHHGGQRAAGPLQVRQLRSLPILRRDMATAAGPICPTASAPSAGRPT